MAKIGDLFWEFRGNSEKLKADAVKAGDTAGKTLGQQMTKALKTGDWGSFLKAGLGLGAGLAVFGAAKRAFGGVADVMGDAIDAASRLQESQSKVDAVFDDSAGVVRDWASDLDASFGLTEQAALESAGTLGNFVQALGLSQDEAVKLSTDITELAGDLSSFNNTSVNDVLVALRSGLAGESEPVRRLGIDISAARIEAILLAKGIQKVNGSFTEGQKVAARYEAIMTDTKTAQGDAARTSDTLAGKQREFNAIMGDLTATIGGLVIGPATDFLGFIVDLIDLGPDLDDTTKRLIARMEELGKTAEAANEATGNMVEAWQPLSEFNVQPFIRFGFATKALVPELVDAANKARLTSDQLHDLLEATGQNEDAIKNLITALNESYYAYDPLSSIMVRTGEASEESGEKIEESTADAAAATLTYAKRVSLASRNIIRSFADLPPGIRDEIKNGKSAVREAMAELRFAMEHPFANDKYAKFLKRKLRNANKALNTAMAEGNLDAANQAAALVTSIETELGRLNDRTYSVDVLVDRSTGRRRSGAAPGRAAGGPVSANQPYWVGETGRRELFIPDRSGRIVPEHQVATQPAASGAVVNAQIYGLPMQASTPRETVAQIRRAASMGLIRPQPRGFQPA